MTNTDDRMALGKRLRAARETAGMSQQDVADRLCIRRPAVSEIEDGKRAVKALELRDLARLYGVGVNYLLGEEVAAQAA